MASNLTFDQIWIENRFKHRQRMTGGKMTLDKATGYLTTDKRGGFNSTKKVYFLNRFKVCSNLSQICKSLSLNVETMYDHIALDPKFRDEFMKLQHKEGRSKQLNNGLLIAEREQKKAFFEGLLENASKYQ